MYLKAGFIKQSLEKKPSHAVHAFISVCMLPVLLSHTPPHALEALPHGNQQPVPLLPRGAFVAETIPSPFPHVLDSYSPDVVLSCVPATAPFDYRAAAAALLGAPAQTGTGQNSIFIKNYSHRLIVIIILFNPAIVSLRPVRLRRDKL